MLHFNTAPGVVKVEVTGADWSLGFAKQRSVLKRKPPMESVSPVTWGASARMPVKHRGPKRAVHVSLHDERWRRHLRNDSRWRRWRSLNRLQHMVTHALVLQPDQVVCGRARRDPVRADVCDDHLVTKACLSQRDNIFVRRRPRHWPSDSGFDDLPVARFRLVQGPADNSPAGGPDCRPNRGSRQSVSAALAQQGTHAGTRKTAEQCESILIIR
jgi:hypothetical protein